MDQNKPFGQLEQQLLAADQGSQRSDAGADLYNLSTPLLDRRMRKVREQVRFPRYYKFDQNW